MFDSLIASYYLEPRVIHQLPGRLRVHILALLHVQVHKKEFEVLLKRLFCLPTGINKVQVRCLTGNVLFEFDDTILTEEEILNWIRIIGKTVIREKHQILNTPAEKIPVIFDRFVEVIQKSIQYRLDVNMEVVIPSDVWQ